MDQQAWIAERFEENRGHLRSVAYRMLGSLSEADDAVQEAWLRLSRSDTDSIQNLGGWLTTVVAHVCLDMLRSRGSRHEESLSARVSDPPVSKKRNDPEQEALLADAVGLALLVVLDRLTPAERLAFVLHDSFGVSFDEIGSIIGKTPAAARQLASRARRRVQGVESVSGAELNRQRGVVEAFLTALRAGDFEGLIAVLDPEVVVRADAAAAASGTPPEVRGAQVWAKQAMVYSRGARFVQPVLIDGTVGAILAPHGRLHRAFLLSMERGKIVRIDVVGDPAHLGLLELTVLDG